MPAIAASPTARVHGPAKRSSTTAASVPESATSAKVRTPALAAGLRSRSRPISRPMARLAPKPSQVWSNKLGTRPPVAEADRLRRQAHDTAEELVEIAFLHAGDRVRVRGERGVDGFPVLG